MKPAVLLLIAAAVFPGSARPQSDDFFYRAQLRDTLIGIGRRLLVDPERWRQVQRLNHIVDPRRIPPGSLLRIPYDWLRRTPQTATVVAVAGSALEGGRKLAVGDVLSQGAVIETGSDGSATLDLSDGSVLTLQKSSVLKLDEMVAISGVAAAASIRLKLDSGRVETKVKPNRDVGRFEIITPVAVSAVRGTQFRDGFNESDRHAATETLEGTVGVAGSLGSVAVASGFGTRVDKDRAPLPPVALLPPPALTGLADVNAVANIHGRLPLVSGARQIRVQVSSDSVFHAVLADIVTADGEFQTPDLADGEYWLRARSIDALGLEGTDAVMQIRQHVLPLPPAPISPTGGAKVAGTRVRLDWADKNVAVTYRLEVASDETFAATAALRSDLRAPTALLEGLPAGRYFWRVAAVNPRGEAGPWSAVQSYTELPSMPPPDAPRVDGKTLIFTWHALAGQSYRAQIARDQGFKHPIRDARVDATEWTVPRLFPGTYYARVQSIDGEGAVGEFSEPRAFVVPLPVWAKVAVPIAIGLALLL